MRSLPRNATTLRSREIHARVPSPPSNPPRNRSARRLHSPKARIQPGKDARSRPCPHNKFVRRPGPPRDKSQGSELKSAETDWACGPPRDSASPGLRCEPEGLLQPAQPRKSEGPHQAGPPLWPKRGQGRFGPLPRNATTQVIRAVRPGWAKKNPPARQVPI